MLYRLFEGWFFVKHVIYYVNREQQDFGTICHVPTCSAVFFAQQSVVFYTQCTNFIGKLPHTTNWPVFILEELFSYLLYILIFKRLCFLFVSISVFFSFSSVENGIVAGKIYTSTPFFQICKTKIREAYWQATARSL